MRKQLILTLVVIVSMFNWGITGVAGQNTHSDKALAAGGTYHDLDDDWPASCDEAPFVSEGSYAGSIDGTVGSGDDSLKMRLDRANYISFEFEIPDRAGDPRIKLREAGIHGEHIEIRGLQNAGLETHRSPFSNTLYADPGETVKFELWAKQDISDVCVLIQDWDWETQWEWEMNHEREHPDVELFDVRQLENEVTDLRQQNSELEAELEEREQEIAELEAELEDADVTIDVSVEPADQATFQVGGEMRVEVDAEGTASSDVTLDFAGQQYTPSDGEAIIPLESAGTQDLSIEYEGMTEVVTLDVATDDDTQPDTDEETVGDDTPPDTDEEAIGDEDQVATDDIPGFGFITALIALGGLLLLSRRQ